MHLQEDKLKIRGITNINNINETEQPKSARELVINLLVNFEENGGYSNLLLNSALKNLKEPKWSGFITTVFYGVIEHRITLDFLIDRNLKDKSYIKLYVRNIMRVAIYECLFLDKSEHYAAVNEAVNIVKTSKYAFQSGMVNGVIRSALRAGSDVIPTGNDAKSISIRFSLNEWLAKSLLEEYSLSTTLKMLEYLSQPAPIYLKINTTKTTADKLIEILKIEEICAFKSDVLDCVLVVESFAKLPPAKTNAFKAGLFHIEDLASVLCAFVVASSNPTKVLDCCAAPGGKSFAVAEMLPTSKIVSADIHPHRVELVSVGKKRLSLENIECTESNAMIFDKNLGEFDVVLCDVPCSGFGVIGKKPEIKYKTLEEIKSLPTIQSSILDNASKYVKVGGRLIYSTCTLLKAENEMVDERFLKNHPDFAPDILKFPKELKQYESSENNHKYTFLPHIHKTDGFYIASFIRKND